MGSSSAHIQKLSSHSSSRHHQQIQNHEQHPEPAHLYQRVDAQMASMYLEDYTLTMDNFIKFVDSFLGDTAQKMVDMFHGAICSILPFLQEDAHMRGLIHEIIIESQGVDAYEMVVRVYEKISQELNKFTDFMEWTAD